MKRIQFGLGLFMLLLLSNCNQPGEFAFRCPGGVKFDAQFRADSVRLELPEGVVTLPVARSASGARYANDTLVFWEHQGAARVELRGRELYTECRPDRGD